jgi:hypothetical protein
MSSLTTADADYLRMAIDLSRHALEDQGLAITRQRGVRIEAMEPQRVVVQAYLISGRSRPGLLTHRRARDSLLSVMKASMPESCGSTRIGEIVPVPVTCPYWRGIPVLHGQERSAVQARNTLTVPAWCGAR